MMKTRRNRPARDAAGNAHSTQGRPIMITQPTLQDPMPEPSLKAIRHGICCPQVRGSTSERRRPSRLRVLAIGALAATVLAGALIAGTLPKLRQQQVVNWMPRRRRGRLAAGHRGGRPTDGVRRRAGPARQLPAAVGGFDLCPHHRLPQEPAGGHRRPGHAGTAAGRDRRPGHRCPIRPSEGQPGPGPGQFATGRGECRTGQESRWPEIRTPVPVRRRRGGRSTRTTPR